MINDGKINTLEVHCSNALGYDDLKIKLNDSLANIKLFNFIDDKNPHSQNRGQIVGDEFENFIGKVRCAWIPDDWDYTTKDKNGGGVADEYIDDYRIQEFLTKYRKELDGVTIQDVRNFILAVDSVSYEKWKRNDHSLEEKLNEKYKDIPEDVRRLAYFEGEDKAEIIKIQDGYIVKTNNESNKVFYCDNEGFVTKRKSTDNLDGGREITEYFNKDNPSGYDDGDYEKITNISTGVIEFTDYIDNKGYNQYGHNKLMWHSDGDGNEVFDSLTVNEGLMNSAEFEIKRNNQGNIVNISPKNKVKLEKQAYIDNSAKLPNNVKKDLVKMLNSGKKLGEDFDLGIDLHNNIKLQAVVKNKSDLPVPTIPDHLNNEYFKMIAEGLAHYDDFELTYENDGNFHITCRSKKAMGDIDTFCDGKEIIYSKDGKTRTTQLYSGDNLVTESTDDLGNIYQNNTSRYDDLMEALVTKQFNKIAEYLRLDTDLSAHPFDNFDCFSVFKKYQDITGKNLMEELLKEYKNGNLDKNIIEHLMHISMKGVKAKDYNLETYAIDTYNNLLKGYNQIRNFDVKDSQIKDLLPQVSRSVISDTEFNETINQNIYNVKFQDSKITVTRNDETYNITDINGADKNNLKILFNMNAEALFQIAKKQTKVIFEEVTTYTDSDGAKVTMDFPGGKYLDLDNSIHIRAKELKTNFINQALVHEVGHSIYNHKKEKNKELEKAFKEEYEKWKSSDEPIKDGGHQHLYCLTSINEMFAEAYVLAVTGHSQAEYTIAKYFPKTFDIIKKIIEERC